MLKTRWNAVLSEHVFLKGNEECVREYDHISLAPSASPVHICLSRKTLDLTNGESDGGNLGRARRHS
jgi:hypothetical protein